MAIQFSVSVRNARLDAIETAIGTSPIMRIRTGAPPASCATADSGTVLATLNLPADWMAAAASGSKSMAGTWQDASADASGVAGHFRIYDSSGAVCHLQGTVTATGGGGDMQVDNVNFATGQQFTVTSFTLTTGIDQGAAFTGTSGNDTIYGGAGDDIITACSGVDMIYVGTGTDTVVLGVETGTGQRFVAPAGNSISTVYFDKIFDMAAGDILKTAYTSINNDATLANGEFQTIETSSTLSGLSVGDNGAVAVRGVYDATAGTFVGSATGSDTLFVYDSNTNAGTTAFVAVVLVGYQGTITATESGGAVIGTLG